MHTAVKDMARRLEDAGGTRLVSVVLYGQAAHGDYDRDTEHFHLLIVLQDLALGSLESVASPIRWWLDRGQPMPRLFSADGLRASADVFPIELLDLTAHHIVVFGADPLLPEIDIDPNNLRLQCERELREKLMRIREAYVEANGRGKALRRLLEESYRAIATVLRGCLYLATRTVPAHNLDAVRGFCRIAGLDAAPFEEIDALLDSGKLSSDVDELFSRYYAELGKAVDAVDRFHTDNGGNE